MGSTTVVVGGWGGGGSPNSCAYAAVAALTSSAATLPLNTRRLRHLAPVIAPLFGQAAAELPGVHRLGEPWAPQRRCERRIGGQGHEVRVAPQRLERPGIGGKAR